MKWAGLAVLVLGLGAAGLYTPSLPRVGPLNMTYTPSGQQTTGALPYGLSLLSVGTSTIPVDTNLPQGQSPQTVGASLFQVTAGSAAEVTGNTATSTAGAATLNARGGVVTTEALTTAPGATYTFTLTNSLFVAGVPFQVVMASGTNLAGTTIAVTSEVVSNGSAVLVFTNTGLVALNGTMKIAFHV